jgi:hypothetical protein
MNRPFIRLSHGAAFTHPMSRSNWWAVAATIILVVAIGKLLLMFGQALQIT